MFPVFGQVTKDTTALSEIRILALPIATSLQTTAASVAVISREEINKSDGIILTPILNKIPGVFMQQGALNTNRITIRGIGARSQYSTNKIKAYFEDIPLTTADGETTIEDIDLESIGHIEIIKGPNSSSFGSGLGGLIQLFARETSSKESFAQSVTTYGSFGLLKQNFSGGLSNNQSNVFTSFTHLQSDGFRQNSSYDRKSVNLHGKHKISTNGSLNFLGIFTRLKAFIPSSINENDFENNPEKGAANWVKAQGFESYDKFVLGIGYKQKLTDKWSFKSSLFSNFKDAYEPRPFDILDDKTSGFGFRSMLNYKNTVFSIPIEASIGTETVLEKYRFSLFENKYESVPNQGSVQGAEFSKIAQQRNYRNYFFQLNCSLYEGLHLETGLAFNTTQYSLEDLFLQENRNPKQSYTFGEVWSPRIGLSYEILPLKNIYASVSNGFSVPTVAESLTPEGKINSNLKSELGWNYELGFKGNWLNNKLYTELTFFSTQISNLLVSRRTAEDQYVGINAGESSHKGLEFLMNYDIIKSAHFQLKSNFSLAVNNFKFKEFIDGDQNHSGNKLTGVPDSQYSLGLELLTGGGFSINSSFSKVGQIPLNDQNSKYSQEYHLLNIKAVYSFTILQKLKTELSAGVSNLMDSHYAASILPNAVGFGKALPRYYYPGNPRNYFGGVALSYLLF